MKKYYPYLILFLFLTVFFSKSFFGGQVIFPASMFYQMYPFAKSDIGEKYFRENPKDEFSERWNALQFDSVLEFYPWRHYLGECYKQGKLPIMNEYSFGGNSFFMANGQSAFYYPLNLIFAVLPTPVAFTVFIILHVFLLQIFMYIYLKRLKLCSAAALFGTLAFGYSSFVVNWLMLPTFVSVITWLPLIAYCMHRFFENVSGDSNTVNTKKRDDYKFAVLGGVSLALCFLAGHLQIAFYVALFVILYSIYLITVNCKNIEIKKLILGILLFIIFFAVLSCPQISQSLQASKLSHRQTEATEENYKWVTDNAIHPVYLSQLVSNLSPVNNRDLLNGFADSKRKHYFSKSDEIEFGMYCGYATLLFAFISLLFIRKKEIIFFAFLTLLFFYMAFGGIVYKLLYYGVPGVCAFGSPCRSICIGLFGLACLSAFGFNSYIEYIKEKSVIFLSSGTKLYTKFLIPLFGFICILILISFAVRSAHFSVYDDLNYLLGRDISKACILSNVLGIIFFAAAFFAVNMSGRNRLKISFVFVLFLFVDLWLAGYDFNETCKAEYVYPKTELTDKLIELDGTVAVINDRWSMTENPHALLPPNMLMYYGIKEIGGYDSLIFGEYKDRLEKAAGKSVSPMENGNMIMIKEPFKGIEKYADYLISIKNFEQYEKIGVYNNVNVYKLK